MPLLRRRRPAAGPALVDRYGTAWVEVVDGRWEARTRDWCGADVLVRWSGTRDELELRCGPLRPAGDDG